MLGYLTFFGTVQSGDVEVLDCRLQCVTVSVCQGRWVNWNFFAVYVSPNRLIREDLWCYLNHFGRLVKSPWLLAENFNQVLDPVEKLGRNRIMWNQIESMRDYLLNCKLVDLGLSGPKFT